MTSAATLFSTALAAASLMALGCAHQDNLDVVVQSGLQEQPPPPPPPRPHTCPALLVDSPLRALESKAPLGGCPGDVQLRPGTYPEADVLFTGPASPAPIILVRAYGHTPLRPPDDADRRRFDRHLVEIARGLVFDVAPYGAGGAAAPPCTASERGLLMSVSDYDDVDVVVQELRRWIHANDLEIELVILLARPPERAPRRQVMEPLSEPRSPASGERSSRRPYRFRNPSP